MGSQSSDYGLNERRRMVDEQVRSRGVHDERVLAAMEAVPRERFVLPEDAAQAFADRALPIALDQTISQPYMVGAMTAALLPWPEHRVLEIGTGSGYQTAVLARVVREVYTIERIAALQVSARSLLESLGIQNVHYRVGDGSLGWPEAAPFDSIMVTAGAPDVPSALVEQLADGGRLVIPVGGAHEQTLTIVQRSGGKTRELPQFPCRFVKLLGRQAWRDTDAI